MKRYRFQVNVRQPDGSREWKDVHPTDEPPYEYDSYDEAYKMMRLCYPLTVIGEDVRVRELED